jgi:P-type Cu2+ transporter
MITGDAQSVADSVARRIGIDEVAAQVLPADKADAVRASRPAVAAWRWSATA